VANAKIQKKKTSISIKNADHIQAAADFGVDISILTDNLKRSPAERIRRHQIALNTAQKLRKAKPK